MPKKALSVTLDEANVLWLKGRARIAGGNVSDALDKLITNARAGRSRPLGAAPSVVGMVDLTDDPDLSKAEAVIKEHWAEYWAKLDFEVNEALPTKPGPVKAKKRRG